MFATFLALALTAIVPPAERAAQPAPAVAAQPVARHSRHDITRMSDQEIRIYVRKARYHTWNQRVQYELYLIQQAEAMRAAQAHAEWMQILPHLIDADAAYAKYINSVRQGGGWGMHMP